jgi:membrane-associated phospholipid phosphatase
MFKTLLAIAMLCGGALALAAQSSDVSAQAINPVVQWNRNLLAIVRTPGAQPATVHPTRSFAMMHLAIYDAVNAIERTHRPYLRHLAVGSRAASEEAAASAAAYEVLIALYPSFQNTLSTELRELSAQIPEGKDKAEGMRIGKEVADRILALRSNDGSNAAPIPFVFEDTPGSYQSTPPNFPNQPQFTHWSNVTPFALDHAGRFRPGPPPAITSDRYADALNQVRLLGIVNSVDATPDEALTGRFWNGAIQNYWNEIAQTAATAHNLTTAQNARLFALLNATIADSVIAFYDAKYTYNFWRPISAIRAADSSENAEITADPNWLPEVGNTTPDPSYPGAHAVISAAASEVLICFFGKNRFEFDVKSEVLPGISRSFTSFSSAAQEASLSRIFAGVHFRFDLTTGQRLGFDIADFVLDNLLTRRRGHGDDESD